MGGAHPSILAAILLAAILPGCVSVTPPEGKTARLITPGAHGPGSTHAPAKSALAKSKTISQKQAERKGSVAADLERRRTEGELHAAETCWQQGDIAGSRQWLEKILSRDPDSLDARLLMAETLLEDDRPQEAEDHLEKALAKHAESARAQYLMGLALDAQGKTQNALACYQRASALNPYDEVYAASYRTALAPPSAVRPADFEETAGSAASGERSESADRAYRRLGEGIAALDAGDESAALGRFREAAAIRPDDPQVPLSAAVALLRHNRPEAAIDLLAPAAARFSESAALYRVLGVACYRRGDYPAAQRALGRALSLDKSDALAYFLMGSTLQRMGQAEAAETHFRQAAALDSRYALER